MKRVAIIVFACLYFIPASGFSLHIHWCGGNASMYFYGTTTVQKCCCMEKIPMGCCKDTYLSLKLPDNQKPASQLAAPLNNFVKLIQTAAVSTMFLPAYRAAVSYEYISYHAPPVKSNPDIYITNKVFLI